MCHPAVMIAMTAASTLMQMRSNNQQAAYQVGVMNHKNKVLEQEKRLKAVDIRRQTESAESTAIAAGGSSGFMGGIGSNSMTSALGFAEEGGRAQYVNELRTSLEQGMNISSGLNAKSNAQSKNLSAMFSFGKSVAMSGYSFGGEG